jgi:antitoxin PrlF
MDELAQLSERGTITLPAAVRRKLGLEGGDVLTVRLAGRSIVLTPAVLTPIELYTDERLAEFEQNAQLDEHERAAARRAWGARRRSR